MSAQNMKNQLDQAMFGDRSLSMELMFISAIRNRDMKAVDQMIRKFQAKIKQGASNLRKYTANLMLEALRQGSSDIAMRFFKECQADPNWRPCCENPNLPKDSTALILASKNGDVELVKLLLDNGAEINLTNETGVNALHEAILKYAKLRNENLMAHNQPGQDADLKSKKEKAKQGLGSAQKGKKLKSGKRNVEYILKVPTESDYLTIINELLDRNSEVNLPQSRKFDPLYFAIDSKNSELIENLIKKGANVNIQYFLNVVYKREGMDPKEYETPLTLALNIPDTKLKITILKLLLKHQANPYQAEFFFKAIKSEDLAVVQFLLSQDSIKVSKVLGYMNDNPFFCAMRTGKLEILKAVMDAWKDLDINMLDEAEGHSTALIIALSLGHIECARFLIQRGANPKIVSNKKDSALHYAAKRGYSDVIEVILPKLEIEDINRRNVFDTSPLLMAIAQKHPRCVKLLLDAHADPNLPSKGFSPLMAISSYDEPVSLEIIELLLQARANVNHIIDERIALLEAIYHNCINAAKTLIKAGANPNLCNTIGMNAVMAAAATGRHEILNLLLQNGGDPNIEIPKYTNALVIAANSGHVKCLDLLLDARWKTPIEFTNNSEGMTALHQSASGHHLDCVERLIIAGANPLALDNAQYNCYMYAINNDDEELLKLLMKLKPIDIDNQYMHGFTLLSFACQLSKHSLIKFLLEAGANPNIANEDGVTVLMYASRLADYETIQLLFKHTQHKINLEQTDCAGFTAIAYAIDSKTCNLLRSFGFKGIARLCLTTLVLSLINNVDIDEISKYIDIKEILFDAYYGEVVSPIYIFSNCADKNVRILALKHKLYYIFSQFERPLINRFVDALDSASTNMQFQKDRSINIELELKNKQYSLSFNDKDLEELIGQFHEVIYTKSNNNEKFMGAFKEMLWKCTEEGKKLQEKILIASLRSNIVNSISTLTNQIWSALTKVRHLKAEAIKTSLPAYSTKFEELENMFISRKNVIDGLINELHERKLIIEGNAEQLKACFTSVLTHSSEITKSQDQLRISMNEFFEKQTKLAENKVSTVSRSSENSSKSSKKKRVQNSSKKSRKAIQVSIPFDATLSASAQKSTSLEQGSQKSISKEFQKEPRSELQEKVIQTTLSAPSTSFDSTLENKPLWETEQLIELKREAESSAPVFKKVATFIPNKPNFIQQDPFPKHFTQHLRIPKRTFESTTQLNAHLKAMFGRKDFDRMAMPATLNATSPEKSPVASYSNQENKGILEQEMALPFSIECDAMKGLLARMLETRKNLGEKWPNSVRNVLFRYEDYITKHFSEEAIIANIIAINQNLKKFPEEILLFKQIKLSLEDIDSENFLKLLSEANDKIPTPTFDDALRMNQKSKQELIEIQNFIRSIGLHALEHEKLKMAIGYVLSRMGIYTEVITGKYDPNSRPKTVYDEYAAIGKEYRHTNEKCIANIDNFILKTLNMAKMPRPIVFSIDQQQQFANRQMTPTGNIKTVTMNR